MADLIKALDVLEFNSKKHRAFDVDVHPVSEHLDPTNQVPLSARSISYIGMQAAIANFKMYWASEGNAGVAPPIGAMLQACGLKETIVAVTSVTYAKDTALVAVPLDIDHYRANQMLHACNSAVGTMGFEMQPGKPMICDFQMVGTYEAPTDAVGAAALETQIAHPICKGLTVTVGAYAAVLKNLKLTLNGVNTHMDGDIAGTNGVQAPQISDMDITWEATIRLPLVATKDFQGLLDADTKVALSAVLGSGAGNVATLLCDGYAYEQLDHGESGGMHEITLKCRESQESADQQFDFAIT